MHSTFFGVSTLGLLAALTSPIDAQNCPYFTMGLNMPLVIERLDPLMSAGKISNHAHSVVGGNGFAPSMDFAQTQTSTCTSAPVKFDKSNYWMPALYYKSPHNGSFIRVPESIGFHHKIYYKYGDRGCVFGERSEFPKEFRMITGNAMVRQDDGTHVSSGDQADWQCHQDNYKVVKGLRKGAKDDHDTDGSFPKGFTSCSGGLAASIRFPSCWNGKDFDPSNPQGHMAFPHDDGLAGCPAPFNVKRFPEIFIEYWLDVSSFNGDYTANDSPWVLANGDPTGYAFHADFINGWELGKLASAMKTCNNGNTGDPLDSNTCFGAGSKVDGNSCRRQPIVEEDVGLVGGYLSTDTAGTHGGILPHLPGCNPIQPGPQAASIQTGCTYNLPTGFTNGAMTGSSTGADVSGNDTSPADSTSAVVPAASGPSVTSSASTMTTSVSSAAVVNQQAKTTPAMPIATATSQKVSTTAAMGSPSESGTTTSSPSGSGSGSTSKTVTASDGSSWSLMGCYTDQLNPTRSLGTMQWWGQKITGTNCVDRCSQIGMSMSGTENAGQCFCGTSLVNSQKADLSECDMPCEGDSSETCGGSAKMSVYKKSGGSHKKTHRHRGRHLQVAS